ncbi:MAG TPA: mRNA surveillance protein pelota [Candidatus Nanoarchaeia archaeon]|nr:mRNA surveillance protein pelota [Candidatus Nanoarchaeia archaeon]
MRLLDHNWKQGFAKILIENLDDLWYLSVVIEPGDVLRGHTTRKVQVGGEDSGKAIRKHCVITLVAEKVEFAEAAAQLRVLGIVAEGMTDIPKGSHHTLALAPQDTITIQKQWDMVQIARITEACTAPVAAVLICILDRDQAILALLSRSGYQLLTTLNGEVERKFDAKTAQREFYPEVLKVLQEYDIRLQLSHLIIASPAFWKENFAKVVPEGSLKKKMILATVASADESALREVLQRPELQQALAKDRIRREHALVEELLAEIAREGLVTYGRKFVAQAIDAGAVRTLLVSDALLRQSKQAGTYAVLEQLMKGTERQGGKIVLIDSRHDGGKRLEGLGGIAALLRYRITFEQ